MKKLFTLFVMGAACCSLSAATLWSGNCEISNWKVVGGGERASVAPAAFTSAKAGDILSVTYSCTADAWVEVWAYDMAPESSFTTIPGCNWAASETVHNVVLTDAQIDELKEKGMALSAGYITFTAIDLTAAGENVVEYGTIWEGSQSFAWNGMLVDASKFPSKLKAGDELVFTCSLNEAGWAAIQVDNGSYKPFLGTANVTETNQRITFVLTAEQVEVIKTVGLNITGSNYTLTKIEVIESEGLEEGLIWKGEAVCTEWISALNLAPDKFAGVLMGDNLYLEIRPTDPAGWSAVQIDRGTEYTNGAFPGNTVLEPTSTEQIFSLSPVQAEELRTYGINFTGANYTLTKVKVLKTSLSGVQEVAAEAPVAAPVYNLQGIRVADSIDAVTAPGLYICGGKKHIKR